MNLDTDATYQTVNLFSSDKCFINFISDVQITFNEISTALSIQFWYKCRYTRYMWSNDMFIPWNYISAILYKDREYVLQNSFFLFINGLIFDIMNTQNNNKSLESE